MEIVLRKARPEDREKVIEVESKSTPNRRYVADVFDMFISDKIGEFSVAEVDKDVVACGKYTVVPDGSVWLETLRVIPERQGRGIGKRFYERWLDIARRQGVKTMRMYTGVKNVVSRGLAERYGLQLAETFRGAYLPCHLDTNQASSNAFRLVTNPDKAASLLMPLKEKWRDFHVMNRTFLKFTPAFFTDLAKKSMIYQDPVTRSVITLGARFQPKQMLHIGLFEGDTEACLKFAMQEGLKRRVGGLNCDFPASAVEVQRTLTGYGFRLTASDFIVMEINL